MLATFGVNKAILFNTSVWGLLIVIMYRVEGLGRLTLRFGATRTIRPERVYLSMFCFQR